MDKLSKGALDKIMSGQNIEKPILQLLGYKKLPGAISDWYRLIVFDGLKKHQYTMLSTELNYLFENGIMAKDTIFKVLNYEVKPLNNEIQTLIIMDSEVLNPDNKVQHTIGNPITNKLESEINKPYSSTAVRQEVMKDTIEPSTSRDTNNSSYEGSIVQIITLSPHKNRNTIKARVINKSPVKEWKNEKKKGTVFSMRLFDNSDEIRCVAFNQECDKFHNKIEDKKVYRISNYMLQNTNMQYNKLKNKYEIVITNNTKIEECHDDAIIPSVLYNFCSISQVENKQKYDEIDVLGVIVNAGDIKSIETKYGTKLVRNIDIVDDSQPHGAKVCITFWEERVQEFDCSNNMILAIKRARVDEYNIKKLTILSSTIIEKNPDLPAADKLRKWYDEGGYSENDGGGCCTFQEMTVARLRENPHSEFFTMMAKIDSTNTD